MANNQACEPNDVVVEVGGAVNQQPPIAEPPQENNDGFSSESSRGATPEPNYRAQYNTLKKKLKYLLYENECFQDALRSSQRRLLKVSRDRSYLLDRLLQYEKPESSTSGSDDTDSSDEPDNQKNENFKKRKSESGSKQRDTSNASPAHKPGAAKRKRAPANKKSVNSGHLQPGGYLKAPGLAVGDGHMTPEEVVRHLQSRQSYLELLPERAPPTVPTEMFSNEPSLDSESNDVTENSPNVEEWYD